MDFNEFLMYSTMLISILFFGGGAIMALAWAIKDGQFENFDRGAKSIFDPDEPIGAMTDHFPGEGEAKPVVKPSDDPLATVGTSPRRF